MRKIINIYQSQKRLKKRSKLELEDGINRRKKERLLRGREEEK